MPAALLSRVVPTAPTALPVPRHPAAPGPAAHLPAVILPAVIRPRAGRPATHPTVYVVRGRPGPDDRPCLPSGHPDTWGRITEGTVLDNAPYPFPIFGT